MARLLEYQGKVLFRKEGIPVPQGQVIATWEEAREAVRELRFPLVVKAQIPRGMRAKAGGILTVSHQEELKWAVEKLLGAVLRGSLVRQLLLEEAAEIQHEFYLGVTTDPTFRQPVLIVSSAGGVDIEETTRAQPEAILKAGVDILRGVYQHDTLDLVSRFEGLSSRTRLELARILSQLYHVYRCYDCKLAEINPLALTDRGAVALDARVDIDDDAVARQSALGLAISEEAGERSATALEIAAGTIDQKDHRGSVHFVQIDPDGSYAQAQGKVSIGFDCVGAGTSLTMMDELVPLGYYPVNFCDSSGNPVGSKLTRITKVIFSQPQIEGYVFVSCVSSQQLDNTARGLIKALQELYPATGGKPNIPCLFVFRGAWDEVAIRLFEEHGLSDSPWVEVLGRETTEGKAAAIFDRLYRRWCQEKSEEDRS